MAKSQIIKDLACNKVSLADAFYRLLVIAEDLDNETLLQWAEKEINGYSKMSELPQYRIINTPNIQYTGINGGYQVTNVPLNTTFLNSKTYERIKRSGVFPGVLEVEKMSQANDYLSRDLTYLSGEVYKNSGGIQCISIRQVIDPTEYIDALSTIKTKLIRVLQKLEREYGLLDDLDVSIDNKTKQEQNEINVYVHNLIYDNNSITIGDNNRIEKSEIVTEG